MTAHINSSGRGDHAIVTVTFYFRSLAQMSVLFGQVVRGLSAGSRVFEVNFTQCKIPKYSDTH